MRIVGGDICKDRVVCWLLEEWPRNLRDYWRSNKDQRSKEPGEDEFTFYFTKAGIEKFLQMEPEVLVLEPTGVHYSWLLANICEQEGIQVAWVGHQEAVYYRKQNKLPDKNDLADALALAAYAHLHWGKTEFFLDFEPGAIARIRELYLQLKSLVRMQSPVINRGRQQLAREFPEVALTDSRQARDGLTPLWAWLANRERGVKANYRYDRLYENSLAPAYGVGISPFTERLANLLCDLHLWEREIEEELRLLLNRTEFKPYIKVFNLFGIGTRPATLLLSQIYPISKFDNLGSFKKRLGMARDEESSGDKLGWKTGSGSKMCRQELYLWILVAIAPTKSRPKNAIGKKLGDFYDKRSQQFYENPDLWKQRAVQEQKRKMSSSLKQQMTNNLLPMMPQHLTAVFEQQLTASLTMFEALLETNLLDEIKEVKRSEAKRGFGNLIICQTAAYGCKLLFKELKRQITQ